MILILSQNYSYSLLNDIKHSNKDREMYVAITIGFRWPVLLRMASTGLKALQEVILFLYNLLECPTSPLTAMSSHFFPLKSVPFPFLYFLCGDLFQFQ